LNTNDILGSALEIPPCRLHVHRLSACLNSPAFDHRKIGTISLQLAENWLEQLNQVAKLSSDPWRVLQEDIEDRAMRESIMAFSPLAAVLYFAAFPSHFAAVSLWISGLLH
jgi:hypothetical protein